MAGDVVVVGASLAGATVATTLRELRHDGRIVLDFWSAQYGHYLQHVGRHRAGNRLVVREAGGRLTAFSLHDEAAQPLSTARHDVALSKRLSYVLRHDPASIGLTLGPGGWVAVDELLTALGRRGRQVSRVELDRVVADNDKQRFAIEATPGGDRIRAQQGHSLPVELGLEPAQPPAVLFHGTPRRNLPSILADGLRRGARHHVHLSPDVQTARRVGGRRGGAVVLAVETAAVDGAFYRSGNGVWLTDAVPPRALRVVG